MSKEVNIAQRYFLQCLINETRNAINKAKRTPKQVTLTAIEQKYLRRLIFQMAASVSTYDNRVSPSRFIQDYMHFNFSSTNKIVFVDREKRQTNYKNVVKILDVCEQIANDYFGTLKVDDKQYNLVLQ